MIHLSGKDGINIMFPLPIYIYIMPKIKSADGLNKNARKLFGFTEP